MLKRNTASYAEIREFLNTVPVIDTHEHYAGVTKPVDNIFKFVFDYYYRVDLTSAAFGQEDKVNAFLQGAA